MLREGEMLPEIIASEWMNSPVVTLASQGGKVVLIYVFQMLCPGCVTLSGPQVKRARDFFSADAPTIIGLHSVFEHHDAMKPVSLKAYLSEFRYDYPVAVDQHTRGNALPDTMTQYGLKGTPSFLLVDKIGRLRRHLFGSIDDLRLGTELGMLISEQYEETWRPNYSYVGCAEHEYVN